MTTSRPDGWWVGMALDHTKLCQVGGGLELARGEVYGRQLMVEGQNLTSRSFYVRGRARS